MRFCDFCPCDTCKDGASYLSHAKTEDGRWICDVCYAYDVCCDGQREKFGRVTTGPCENWDCEHRPKIVPKWEKYTPMIKVIESRSFGTRQFLKAETTDDIVGKNLTDQDGNVWLAESFINGTLQISAVNHDKSNPVTSLTVMF